MSKQRSTSTSKSNLPLPDQKLRKTKAVLKCSKIELYGETTEQEAYRVVRRIRFHQLEQRCLRCVVYLANCNKESASNAGKYKTAQHSVVRKSTRSSDVCTKESAKLSLNSLRNCNEDAKPHGNMNMRSGM